jgi:hypothetical protein
MTDEILRELIEFIENASPAVWSTLLKQVRLDAFSGLAWAVVMIVVAVVAFWLASSAYKNDNSRDDWREEKMVGGSIAFVLSSVVAFALSVDAIMRLVNPEFYAIRFILMQIGGGG